MPNPYFQFKQFTIIQDHCAMKVTTDASLFGSCLPLAPADGEGNCNVLDIGTGCGLLALMYAQKNPHAIIDAIEIDREAANQASENVAASPWKNRINVICDDARTYPFQKPYDLIISNPPFYENELKSPDSKRNIAFHEGLTLNELLEIIRRNLRASGIFSLLLPFKRDNEIKTLFKKFDFYEVEKLLVKQTVSHDYFRIVVSGKITATGKSTITREIAIRDDNEEYTNEFSRLLKDYYLKM